MAVTSERDEQTQKRNVDLKLDVFENMIERLRIAYEQHFVGVIPLPPIDQQKELERFRRQLLNEPFKNSASIYRLKMLLYRYQTYATYWERVNKQKENGSYRKDKVKAQISHSFREEDKRKKTKVGKAEEGIKQLFRIYKDAVEKTTGQASTLDFNSFKSSLMTKTKAVKQQTGASKLSYKIEVKDGKVSLKASAK